MVGETWGQVVREGNWELASLPVNMKQRVTWKCGESMNTQGTPPCDSSSGKVAPPPQTAPQTEDQVQPVEDSPLSTHHKPMSRLELH